MVEKKSEEGRRIRFSEEDTLFTYADIREEKKLRKVEDRKARWVVGTTAVKKGWKAFGKLFRGHSRGIGGHRV